MSQPDDSLALSCKCGHHWIAQFRLPMEMGEWIKRVSRLRCPECGAKNRDLKINFGDASMVTSQDRGSRNV